VSIKLLVPDRIRPGGRGGIAANAGRSTRRRGGPRGVR